MRNRLDLSVTLIAVCLLFTAVLISAATTGAIAANIAFGNLVPGMGAVDMQVVSIREQRFDGLVQQNTDFSCGAAALATLLNGLYDYNTTEAEVMAGMLKVADRKVVLEKGFSMLDIKNYVQSLDLRGRGYRVDEQTLSRMRVPTIVLIDMNGYKHFVVLKKITESAAYIGDSALGNKIIPRGEFLSMWNGVIFAVLGKGINMASPLMSPRESPLSVSKETVLHAPLTETELLEFGFSHADFF